MDKTGYIIQLVTGIVLIVLLLWYITLRPTLGPGEFLVKDREGGRMVIQVNLARQDVIEELVGMHENRQEKWVGGEIEEYDNEFGFRFKPDTIIVAEYTAEALQAGYYRVIASNFTYWHDLGVVYIWGTVVRTPR